MVVGLPEKAIQKVDKELLELHKEVLKSYLTQRSLKHKYQKKFFKIYDHYITEKNIRRFLNQENLKKISLKIITENFCWNIRIWIKMS